MVSTDIDFSSSLTHTRFLFTFQIFDLEISRVHAALVQDLCTLAGCLYNRVGWPFCHFCFYSFWLVESHRKQGWFPSIVHWFDGCTERDNFSICLFSSFPLISSITFEFVKAFKALSLWWVRSLSLHQVASDIEGNWLMVDFCILLSTVCIG